MTQNKFINILLCFLIVFDYCVTCFSNYTIYFNFLSVIFIFICCFFFYSHNNINYLILFLAFLDILIIILNKDVSNISLLVFGLVISLTKDEDVEVNTKDLFFTSLFCMLIIVFLYYFLGFNSRFDTTIWRPNQGLVNRKSLGFTHPNQFMIKVLSIYFFGLLSFRKKISYSIIFTTITYFLYAITKSRTVFLIILVSSILVIFIYALGLQNIRFNKNIIFLLSLSPILMLVISICISCFFANTKIDTYFSGRLIINKYFLDSGIGFLGNNSLSNETFDNSYIQMLLSSGLLFYILYSFIWIEAFKKIKSIDIFNIIALFGTLFLSFMEVCLLKYSIIVLISICIDVKIKSKGVVSDNDS